MLIAEDLLLQWWDLSTWVEIDVKGKVERQLPLRLFLRLVTNPGFLTGRVQDGVSKCLRSVEHQLSDIGNKYLK